jgi:peptidoglycan/xylan/chitin deacetylase (PgdA/CDA1 family)
MVEGTSVADVLVLCFHAISPSWPAPLSTTPERFARQIEHLARRGYRGVTFGEAVGGAPDGKVVAVTFDDGYRSVGELARSVLDRVGWPGTVFVPTDHVGTGRPMAWPGIDEWLGGRHEHELVGHDWDELRQLRDAGWEIGAHTCSHPLLTTLADAALARELRDSKAIVERELGSCSSIAYPYGDVDPRVVRATAAAGYAFGAALPERPHAPRPLEWPRVGVYHVDDLRRFRLKVAPLARTVRSRLACARP